MEQFNTKIDSVRGSSLIEVKNLKKYFRVGDKNLLHAIDGVSFSVQRGETLGLVGESGCGKSTVGTVMMRLQPPTSGEVLMGGKNIFQTKGRTEDLELRKRMQIIFQDPYSSLNPKKRIRDILAEAYKIHKTCTKEQLEDTINQLCEMTGISPDMLLQYPHELDGGKRQVVGIARALSLRPEFIVCDEPVSALDVSIQAQVVNMFEDLQQEMGLTYLFIAHDLSVVKHISNRIGVMYLGKMVELADSYELITHSIHPYTRSLISAIPVADPITARQSKRIVLQGDVPSPLNPPSGCRFRTRCPYADEQCANECPQLREVSPGHFAACHHLDKVAD